MDDALTVGDAVQTSLGKGVVREVRNGGRVLVEVHGRAVELKAALVARLEATRASRRQARADTPRPHTDIAPSRSGLVPVTEVDLHGLTVEEALGRVEEAVNAAILGDLPQLRLIHGRSGGRIRAALHRRLREIPTVRAFQLDPHNPGVTIVSF
jgi:dsDNA-specific endonuclease/ATPase MutS2